MCQTMLQKVYYLWSVKIGSEGQQCLPQKSLNETEKYYEIHDKEMLVVIRGLENWRNLLEGVKYKFEVWTDHKNLEYFMKVQKLNCKQAQ